MSMISEFVEEIKAKINRKKEYHKNFYEMLGQTLNDNDLHKATQLAFDDCMEIVNKLAEKYRDVPDTNAGKNLSENLIEKFKDGAFRVKTSDLSFINLERAIGIVNQLAEEYKDVPDTNAGKWIPVSERFPENTDPVNITWVNHKPEPYYADIKDKPFTATGCYCDGKWYWYSVLFQDYLDEYRYSENDYMDNGIEVIAWQPLPEPYKGE